jgi:hypothetical protein
MPSRRRRPLLPVPGRRLVWRAGVLASALVVGTAGPALAAPASTVGQPQPELALFRFGASGSDGTGAVLADGTIVLATLGTSGNAVSVCVVHVGGRACAVDHSFSIGDLSGPAEVLTTGGREVSVIVDADPSGVIVYNSSNDGVTFAPPVTVGPAIYGVDSGTAVGSQVVVAGVDPHSGIEVQAFGPTAPGGETALAQVSADDSDASVTNDNGGVLVAGDDTTNTHVQYAPAGSDFNAGSSYRSVGSFANQTVTGISGNALLTDPDGSITGGEDLRFFNGTTFGAAHKVPEPTTGDDGGFSLQEVGGVVHVFYLNRRHGYDIYSATTRDGVHWSSLHIYNTAVTSGDISPVLGPDGAGVVFEADSTPLLAQPILNSQDVNVRLVKARIAARTSTRLRGTVSPHLRGLTVTLQRFSAGRWYRVAASHESAIGAFAFRVKAADRYRVVVSDVPGSYLYGYSRTVTLTVT